MIGITGMKSGDILTNDNGVTCVYTFHEGTFILDDIDKSGRLTGDHIQDYIQHHELKVTDHINNYPEEG